MSADRPEVVEHLAQAMAAATRSEQAAARALARRLHIERVGQAEAERETEAALVEVLAAVEAGPTEADRAWLDELGIAEPRGDGR